MTTYSHSRPRNPIIAKIFRFVKFSENIGSGFNKMFQGWKKHYDATPIVEGDFDWYKITFPFNRSIIKTTNKTTNKPDIGSELIVLLENNPNLSMVEIGQKLQITPHNVQYYINKLKDAGRIKRAGSKKTGKWVVK